MRILEKEEVFEWLDNFAIPRNSRKCSDFNRSILILVLKT
jgi:hypothetical protein